MSPEHRAKMSAALKGHVNSAEARAKMSAAHRGKRFSPEHRAKMSESARRRLSRGGLRGLTSLERALYVMLYSAGFHVIAQQKIGRSVVDAWVPEYGLAFEANGEPWHTWNEAKRPGYHERRTKALNKLGVHVINLTATDLAPWL